LFQYKYNVQMIIYQQYLTRGNLETTFQVFQLKQDGRLKGLSRAALNFNSCKYCLWLRMREYECLPVVCVFGVECQT
jgi:hypothetical protein